MSEEQQQTPETLTEQPKVESVTIDVPESTALNATDPYKSMEFEIFIKMIGESNLENWQAAASALGVDRATIWRWRQHPRARKALAEAGLFALKMMRAVGFSDWKMWREYAKIAGIEDIQTVEHRGGLEHLIKNLESDYDEYSRQIEGQVVENDTPVQDQGQTGEDSTVQTELNADQTHTGEGEPQEEPDPQG